VIYVMLTISALFCCVSSQGRPDRGGLPEVLLWAPWQGLRIKMRWIRPGMVGKNDLSASPSTSLSIKAEIHPVVTDALVLLPAPSSSACNRQSLSLCLSPPSSSASTA
jgi:hypothetical protein